MRAIVGQEVSRLVGNCCTSGVVQGKNAVAGSRCTGISSNKLLACLQYHEMARTVLQTNQEPDRMQAGLPSQVTEVTVSGANSAGPVLPDWPEASPEAGRPIIDGHRGGHHVHQLSLIAGSHDHHVGQAGHVGDIKCSAVGRAICPHQAPTVHGKPHCRGRTAELSCMLQEWHAAAQHARCWEYHVGP